MDVWDQGYWDQQGNQNQPFNFNKDFVNTGTIDPAQLGRQKSTPSGTVVNGQYWDYLKGSWQQAPQGSEGFQWEPGATFPNNMPNASTGQNGMGQIKTSITPQGIFSNRMTNAARNQAVAQWHQKANMNQAMKTYDRPGISRGAQSIYRAMPGVASAYTNAAQAGAAIPLSDYAANQQNLLKGQLNQANEFNGLANILLGQYGLNNYVNQQNIQSLVPLLNAIMGMV